MNEDQAEPTVIFSDEHIVVVDKPAGLPALPGGWAANSPHLAQLLAPQFGRLWIVHRLDRGTSGVMVLARSADAHRALNIQFDAHTVRKVYHTLVHGEPPWESYTCRLPLRPDGDRKHRTVVDHGRGKPSVTHLVVLERLPSAALVEAAPETGRTHQIRAHLAALKLPVVGDALYNPAEAKADGAPVERPALHAAALSFTHPATEAPVTFEAPHPPDFAALLEQLRIDAVRN